MSKRVLYTTSEYLDALKLQRDGNLYQCEGKEFAYFSNADAAEYDAQFFFDFWKRSGQKKRKPTVYRIKLERVSRRVKT